MSFEAKLLEIFLHEVELQVMTPWFQFALKAFAGNLDD